MGGLKVERGVPAVLLQDILSSIPSNTVILKLDVQGYECKVRKQLKNTRLVFSFSFFFWWGEDGFRVNCLINKRLKNIFLTPSQ